MTQFHSRLSDESDQYASTTAMHLHIILHFLLSKGFIASLLTTMRDNTYVFIKQYSCASTIYLLSRLGLFIFINIYIADGAPQVRIRRENLRL